MTMRSNLNGSSIHGQPVASEASHRSQTCRRDFNSFNRIFGPPLGMSLFKVRDFWSFDLDQLNSSTDSGAGSPPQPPTTATLNAAENNRQAQFIVSVGRFSAIGSQDVFVCGTLKGFIYIIQVPECDQRKYIRRAERGAQERPASVLDGSPGSTASGSSGLGERQLLAATYLGLPLVDVKCGFFTSALKQSVAVLSFDKLLILRVKRHQVDLLSGPTAAPNPRAGPIDENLLSHEFEEYVKLDLVASEFAYSLLVLNSHAEGAPVESSSPQFRDTDLDGNSYELASAVPLASNRFKQAGKQAVRQQLHLPQRDRIIVQYTSQLVFSLIDNKKISAHFRITNFQGDEPARGASNLAGAHGQSDAKLESMSQFVGAMPMAHLLGGNKASTLIVLSFSDHRLHCVSLEKLSSRARQNVMKRVALNLLGTKAQSSSFPIHTTSSPQESGQNNSGLKPEASGMVDLDLAGAQEWSQELMSLPLQMQGIQRLVRPVQMPISDSRHCIGQLLVMSRYSLDLFESSGEHLWHQRSETPLICFFAYTLDGSTPSDGQPFERSQQTSAAIESKMEVRFEDQIISMLCSDGLHEDKSNLMIMKDNESSWSALLSSRPSQAWRINLSLMPGLLAMLDMDNSQLVAGYLGTNLNPDTLEAPESDQTDASNSAAASGQINQLVEMELMNEPLFDEDKAAARADVREDQRERLIVTNLLETGPQEGSVSVFTSIQLAPNFTSVAHNIVLTFEFDDLIEFSLRLDRGRRPLDGLQAAAMDHRVHHLTRGVVEVHLGNCWPDRGDPLQVESTFDLGSSSGPSARQFGAHAMDNLDDNQDDEPDEVGEFYSGAAESKDRPMPKSLLVRQFLTFSETHWGQLHQEHAFLLPLNLVANLKHVDYSSGQGQDLNDVLSNLSGYNRAGEYCQCDLFLELVGGDFISLLDEIVEGDLICHGNRQLASNNQSSFAPCNSDRNHEAVVRKMNNTLESLSLLGQSLNCRIRYMSPSPPSDTAARRSSEDPARPVIVTLAVRLKNKFLPSAADGIGSDDLDPDEDQVVWIHICDMSPTPASSIVEDFVATHMKNWKQYRSGHDGGGSTRAAPGSIGTSTIDDRNSRVLISIESNRAIPALFLLEHLLDRVDSLTQSNPKLSTELIITNAYGTFGNFQGDLVRGGNRLSISNKLHDSLVRIADLYESEHKAKCKQLQEELAKEYCKFQLVTANSLSLAKRIASLPDHMCGQLDSLMSLAKQYQLRLMSILDGLDSMRRCDYEYSKIPDSNLVMIELLNNEPVCGRFSRVIN